MTDQKTTIDPGKWQQNLSELRRLNRNSDIHMPTRMGKAQMEAIASQLAIAKLGPSERS
ncbi:hypothetical protein V6259_17625 [Marinomonas sp. TI.3.20]|uniref:hypothetical protein n=1 Tax=Marinomonas sp. TI.3.20 TaxID=3121296 RepID=UPI00311D9DDC